MMTYLEDLPDGAKGKHRHADQQVCHCQRNDEEVGDGAQLVRDEDRGNHETVATDDHDVDDGQDAQRRDVGGFCPQHLRVLRAPRVVAHHAVFMLESLTS